MTKREELARIIDPDCWHTPAWEDANGPGPYQRAEERAESLEKVDAILAALREPSEGMVAAAVELPLTKKTGRAMAPMKAVARWQAMIDNLKQEPSAPSPPPCGPSPA